MTVTKFIDKAKRTIGLGRKAERPRVLGGSIDEWPAFCNTMAFGSDKAAKAVSVIYPALNGITAVFKNKDDNREDAKWGGLVLDPTGSLYESIIYILQRNGRNPVEDLLIVRPDSDDYLLQFEELSSKERFFVNASGGSEPEAEVVLATAVRSKVVCAGATGNGKAIRLANGQTEVLCARLFDKRKEFLRPEVQTALAQLEFDVAGKSIRWLGWREQEGDCLARVINTRNGELRYSDGRGNEPTRTIRPRRLRLVGVHALSGHTFNLVPQAISSTEAAGWLVSVHSRRNRGDNPYWAAASEKHAAFCIELFRQVHGSVYRQCSIQDLHRLVVEDSCLQEHVQKLKSVLPDKQASDEGALCRNLLEYFEGEWLPFDRESK